MKLRSREGDDAGAISVLSDLGTAENLEAVTSTMLRRFGGYGYKIRAGERARATIDEATDLLRPHAADIEWVFQEFGTHGSADLKLESTIRVRRPGSGEKAGAAIH